MAIVKAVSSKASLKRALDYVKKNEKTEDKLISGINCSVDFTLEEMETTKQMWDKTDGRTYMHYVQSYHPDDPITPEQAHQNALDLVKQTKEFDGFEVLVATHIDKDHIHSHIIVNSVSAEDGHKLQSTPQDLARLKARSNEQSRQQGLHVPEKGKTFEGKKREETSAYTKEAYQQLKKAEAGEVKSYVQDIALAVMEEKEKATSKDEFIANLQSRGIGVEWQDNHKYITFIDIDRQEHGEKQCKIRDNKLAKYYNMDFSKESLLNEFERNIRKSEEREQQLDGAIEQIRESDRRTEPTDKAVGNGAEARESQNREIPRTEAKLSRESFTSFGTEARASDPKPRSKRMGEFKQAMAETTERIGRAGSSMERTLQQAGSSLSALSRSIGAGEEQQDGIEAELRAEQQLIETVSSAVFDITAELERFTREVDRAEAEQLHNDFNLERMGRQVQHASGKIEVIGAEQRSINEKANNLRDKLNSIRERIIQVRDSSRQRFSRTEQPDNSTRPTSQNTQSVKENSTMPGMSRFAQIQAAQKDSVREKLERFTQEAKEGRTEPLQSEKQEQTEHIHHSRGHHR